MMQKISLETPILCYIDIHGHSCKKNAFMYGCEYEVIKRNSFLDNFILRSLPAYFDSISKYFSIEDCNFKNEKAKEKTGRIVCFKEFKIRYSFTLEWSYFGYLDEDGEEGTVHMETQDFEKLGEDLAKSFVFQSKLGSALEEQAQIYNSQKLLENKIDVSF